MTLSEEETRQDIVYTSKNSLPSECEPLHNDLPLLHDWFEVFFVKAGDVSWLIEDELHPAPPFSFVVFNSQEIHKLQIRSDKRFERMKLLFNPDLARQFEIPGYDLLSPFLDRPKGRKNLVNLSRSQGLSLLGLFERMGEAMSRDCPEAPLLRLIALLEILIFVHDAHGAAPEEAASSSLPDKVLEVMDYVNRNLVGDLSLDAISGKCGISRYYLCRMFKKETGSTLHNYILFKRVSEAKRLLAAGLKVAQASELCGFGSVIRLSAAFSKVVGKTPGAYAKELRRS